MAIWFGSEFGLWFLRKNSEDCTMNHNKLNLKAKVLLGILILLCMVAFFYVLHIRFLGKSPCNQVGTSWRTSDGRITFSVVETDPAEDLVCAPTTTRENMSRPY